MKTFGKMKWKGRPSTPTVMNSMNDRCFVFIIQPWNFSTDLSNDVSANSPRITRQLPQASHCLLFHM